MKKIIQIRKHASAIIQHGKYNLQEITQDVVVLEWKYENRVLKAIFNQSKDDYLFRERSSNTSKQLPRIGESACHLSKRICYFSLNEQIKSDRKL